MADPFREAEGTFTRLREKFEARKISQQEFTDSLRRLRIKDEDGRFWVIGARSGRWYAFENDEWVEAKPPSLLDKRVVCIACGFENDIEAERCVRCGGRPMGAGPDPAAGKIGLGRSGLAEAVPDAPGVEVVVRSFDVVSFLWFFGVLGLFAGILLGLLAGVTGLFAGFVERLPGFFVEHRGDILGALAFSIVGGILGFAAGAAAGVAAAAVSNGVMSLVGGLKLRRS